MPSWIDILKILVMAMIAMVVIVMIIQAWGKAKYGRDYSDETNE